MKSFLSGSKKYVLGALLGVAVILSIQAMDSDPYFEISKNLEIIGEETLATKFENVSGKTDDANELGLWLELVKNS